MCSYELGVYMKKQVLVTHQLSHSRPPTSAFHIAGAYALVVFYGIDYHQRHELREGLPGPEDVRQWR